MKVQEKGDKFMLSMKDLVFKYMGSYTIEEVVFTNAIKTTNYNKDSSDSEHKLSSKIQRACKGTEGEGAKTNKSRQGREMKDRKNTK